MSSEWHYLTVEDIAAPQPNALSTGPFGSAISSKFFTTSGIPVIRGSNLSSETFLRLIDNGIVFVTPDKATEFRRSVARRGDLIFTCWGTINQIGLIDSRAKYDEYIVSNKQMKLTVDAEKADSLFLYYVFSGPDKQSEILDNGIGSSVPGFNLGQLKKHRVLLPSLFEQKQIATFLGMLDDRITLLRETNATLEAIAQALFKSWFVDFDPVRAKIEDRAPEGIDEATAALFPSYFTETSTGPIPAGWVHGTFGNVLTETSDRVGKQEATVLSAVQTGHLVRSEDHFNKRVHSKNIAKYKCVPPLSFAYNPSRINIGSIGLNDHELLGAVSPVYVVAAPRCAGSAYLIWHHLRTPTVQQWIKTLASGTVRQSLSYSDFCSIPLVIPRKELLEAFLRLRSSLYKRFDANCVQAQTLTTLRDTLLPRLICGQLRLPEAEALTA